MDAVDKGHAKIGAAGRSGSDIVCTGGGTGNIRLELPLRECCGSGSIRTGWRSAYGRDDGLIQSVQQYLGGPVLEDPAVQEPLRKARKRLEDAGFTEQTLRDEIVSSLVRQAERICAHGGISRPQLQQQRPKNRQNLTSKATGFPIMIALLACIFWLTIAGANLPSQWLSAGLFWIEEAGRLFLLDWAPQFLCDMLVHGARIAPWRGYRLCCAHGHLLPFVYSIGRFGLSAPGSI